jgi:hypothetical protein
MSKLAYTYIYSCLLFSQCLIACHMNYHILFLFFFFQMTGAQSSVTQQSLVLASSLYCLIFYLLFSIMFYIGRVHLMLICKIMLRQGITLISNSIWCQNDLTVITANVIINVYTNTYTHSVVPCYTWYSNSMHLYSNFYHYLFIDYLLILWVGQLIYLVNYESFHFISLLQSGIGSKNHDLWIGTYSNWLLFIIIY